MEDTFKIPEIKKNDKNENVNNLKNEGNECFANKKYEEAIIKSKCAFQTFQTY
jgi:hypothetical protein